MTETGSPIELSLEQARAVALAAQEIDGSGKGGLVATVERTGFVRTLGGADVYLAVRARVPGLRRADLDAAVERGDLRVVPAARGCIYLVPRRYLAMALKLADLLSRPRAARDHERAGVGPDELEDVARAVLATLRANGAMTTNLLRRRLPAGTVRSLGEQGKKVGLSSTLPPALRRLEFDGLIERVHQDGRLDSERYSWRIPEAGPFAGSEFPDHPADLHTRIAEIFFRAAGLGSRPTLAAWSGLGQSDARAAMDRLELVRVVVEGRDEELFALAERRSMLASPPAARGVAFLPFADNAVALHGGPAFLTDPAHHGLEVPSWGRGKPVPLGEARHASLRSIVADGKIVGFWELDLDRGEIVTAPFAPLPEETRAEVSSGAADLYEFLTTEIGHARSFTLDTEKDMRRRAEQIRGMGGS